MNIKVLKEFYEPGRPKENESDKEKEKEEKKEEVCPTAKYISVFGLKKPDLKDD